jgi:hypothetical protein
LALPTTSSLSSPSSTRIFSASLETAEYSQKYSSSWRRVQPNVS